MLLARPIMLLLLLQACRAYNPAAAGAVSVRRAADLARMAAPRAVVASTPAPTARRTEGKLYTVREAPKVAGGVKVGARRVVVITGASSGLGLSATIALLAAAQKNNYFVVAAVRDPERMENVAKENGISRNDYVRPAPILSRGAACRAGGAAGVCLGVERERWVRVSG